MKFFAYKEAHSDPFSGRAAAHLLIGEKLLRVARGGKDAFEILRLLADSTNTPPFATADVAAHEEIA